MNNLADIISRLQDTVEGDPWFGKAVMKVFEEVNPSIVYKKPGANAHSLIELLYHMLTWQQFTLQQLVAAETIDPEEIKQLDWRVIDPNVHTWEKGISAFTSNHQKMMTALSASPGEMLHQTAKHREYNMETLLRGLIEHHIYHIGQVAYVNKLLAS